MNMIINNADSLREAIKQLEEEQLKQKKELTDSYGKKIQSFKPVNILKSSVSNISGKSLKKTALVAGAGLGAAFIFRKFLFKKALSVPFSLLGFIGKAAIGSAITRLKK